MRNEDSGRRRSFSGESPEMSFLHQPGFKMTLQYGEPGLEKNF
jgi:hypothetical protein